MDDKVDKRKKKTSLEQYNIYLSLLESDDIFRTGSIPTGVNTNYLIEKWKELTDDLNKCENGPKLYPEEWRKRLMDWKHTTRSKYRKSLVNNLDGSKSKINLAPLEQRAMKLWGLGVVKKVIPIDIKTEQEQGEENPPQSSYTTTYVENPRTKSLELVETYTIIPAKAVEEIQIEDCKPHETSDNDNLRLSSDGEYMDDTEENEMNEMSDHTPTAKKTKYTEPNIEFCNATTLVNNLTQKGIHNLTNELKRLNDIKEKKLKFEIAKFKFNNPGFEYDF